MSEEASLSDRVVSSGSVCVVYRSGAGHIHWADGEKTLRVPVASIEEVRALGNRLEVVVTPHLMRPPSLVYAVDGADAESVKSFVEAVRRDVGRLGFRRSTGVWRRRPPWAVFAAVMSVVLVAVDVTVAVRGTELPLPLPLAQIFGSLGAPLLIALGIVYRDEWVLRRRGVTTTAVLVGYTHQVALYRYTDSQGQSHQYRSHDRGERAELRYDPRRPSRASAEMRPLERYGLLIPLLAGAGMVGAMLAYTAYGLLISLTSG